MPRKYVRKKGSNSPGRPPYYATAEELQAKIKAYFNGGAYKRKVITSLGEKIEIPTPTITDLVLFLGFADKQSFYDLEVNPKFSYTIKRARTFIEREYENCLRQTGCTGAIFALKNFGWVDKTEIEHTGDISLNFQANGTLMSPKEREYAQNN